MQRTTDIPWQLSQVLQAVVIVAIASGFVFARRRPVDDLEDPVVPAPVAADADDDAIGRL